MHLCFSITAHGFGHGAISTAVIQKIMQYFPEIKITVLTLLPKSYLDSRLTGEFTYIKCGHDFGMLMHSPIEVDIESSRKKYQVLFDRWQEVVNQEVEILKQLQPDCVISNVSPITLDAAIQLGIPTVSVAPFNWAQIYKRYCFNRQNEQTVVVYERMMQVYKKVDYIYKPLPSVPLGEVHEIHIASINSQPQSQRDRLLSLLPEGTHSIVLVALGGLPITLNCFEWPVIPHLQWLVDQPEQQLRSDMTQVSSLDLSFLELVGSCDVILTKPGYGTYCEIAAIADQKRIRVISLERPDWPETPFLNQFLIERVPFLEININQLEGKQLNTVIEKVNKLEYPTAQTCEDGAKQLVEHLLAQLTLYQS
jgi:hypothetical protein